MDQPRSTQGGSLAIRNARLLASPLSTANESPRLRGLPGESAVTLVASGF